MSLLRRIQSKPSIVKAHYAIAIAGLFTGIVAIIWVSTLPARLNNLSEGARVEKESSSIKDFFSETKTQLGAIIEWDENSASAPISEPTPIEEPQHEPVSSALSNMSMSTDTPSEASTSTPQKNETPRVVLIATTTREKSE